jgi:hypothetical protein
MSSNDFYLIMVLGFPIVLLMVAMVAGCLNHGEDERVLDWKLTRSPKREAELSASETHQMLNALNRYRRLRGVPERSLDEIAEHGWARLDRDDELG